MGIFNFFNSNSNVDPTALDNVVYTMNLINEFKKTDEGNFIGYSIYGMNQNNEVTTFKYATQLFFKISYIGSSMVWVFEKAPDGKQYVNYTSLFKMFSEDDDSHSFCCKWGLKGSNGMQLLNSALQRVGINKQIKKDYEKSIYISLT